MAPSIHHSIDINNSSSYNNPHDLNQTIPDKPFRVLITGFGPFSRYIENPSWLAVKSLHNVVITPDPSVTLQSSVGAGKPPTIHITAFEVPVTYDAVLETIPGLYARPPILPPTLSGSSPPDSGYDFIMHVGVASAGPLRAEMLGHKYGYNMPDAEGKPAPVVDDHQPPLQGPELEQSEDGIAAVMRGFPNAGYHQFPPELVTTIDIERLAQDLQRSGTLITASKDAGHYLCDFIYYCSLAESRRNIHSSNSNDHTQPTPVFFLHCCPVGEPLDTQQVTEEIKRIIVWVCNEVLQEKPA